MDQTECIELPFPECDPPLVKDASDIEQFEDLAQATDAAVTELANTLDDTLFNPDAARMTGGITTAGQLVNIPFTVAGFDNTAGDQMTDVIAGGIRIVEAGWYNIGGHVLATHAQAAGIGMRVQPMVNGSPYDSRQGPGRPTLAGASATDDVAWQHTAHLAAGDLLTVQINHPASAALSVTYAAAVWALLVLSDG